MEFASLMNIHTALFGYLIQIFLKGKYVSNCSIFLKKEFDKFQNACNMIKKKKKLFWDLLKWI